ncbi:L,D-transpeptidase-like protein [Pseudonocardia sediminis]|uniref:L,D-transpeptidase-like protein n=1 Tax=Pseudonocardia sediminis TaxID=1397368 RepID=A0A4Q7V3K4_PSEST|nr:L,D-transpeptidase [Pseudonocardia sediminis]RZT88986.1 L,D-transpeptidase-like protein [Pseudonocardia sediminis]
MSSNRQAGTRLNRRVVAGVLSLVAAAGVALAGSAAADSPAAEKNRAEPLVAGTPCTATAKACVDLDSQQSWLFKDGKIMSGPIKISSGGNGQETPIGHSLRVYRKEADHKSQESRLPNGDPAPMPWSVFFNDGGIAFHSGDPNRSSAGCIHVPDAQAKGYFDYLQIGDQVQVLRLGEEKAARGIK